MPEEFEMQRLVELGRLQGELKGLSSQVSAHVKQTDDRFVRLEETVREGFRHSQLDREAGNTTLGAMIKSLEQRISLHQDELTEEKGASTLWARIIDIIVMLFGGAGVGLVVHFFH